MVGARPAVPLQTFWAAWSWWLPPAVTALILILVFVDPFVGDWDGLDYTILALRGYPSSMALGRSLFIFFNHALYVVGHALFNVQPSQAYLIFKYAVVAQGPLAVIACWFLAHQVSGSLYSATAAALFVTFSPVFVLYGGQVMTDVPSILLLALALAIHLVGVQRHRIWMVLIGAALLGAAVNVRETVGFYAPWLVLAPFVCGWERHRREVLYVLLSCLIFLVAALGGFAYWFLTDAYFRQTWFGWRESMQEEAARHPVIVHNVVPFAIFFFVVSPVVMVTLPIAAIREWRERGLSSLLLLAAVGLWANLLLLLNYSTSVVWRYLLTGLPALAPLTADCLVRSLTLWLGTARAALISAATVIALIAILFALYMRPVSREFIERRALSKDYNQQLARLPQDAVMISGSQTVAVNYWRGIGEGHWDTIGTGGGWPGEHLTSVIETYLKQGRRVFLDADPRWWLPCGWQRDEIPEIAKLETHFRFRQASKTVYELRPVTDDTARDSPNLKRLLPENRPEDLKKCPGVERLAKH